MPSNSFKLIWQWSFHTHTTDNKSKIKTHAIHSTHNCNCKSSYMFFDLQMQNIGNANILPVVATAAAAIVVVDDAAKLHFIHDNILHANPEIPKNLNAERMNGWCLCMHPLAMKLVSEDCGIEKERKLRMPADLKSYIGRTNVYKIVVIGKSKKQKKIHSSLLPIRSHYIHK